MLDKRQQLTMLASIKEFWTYNKNYIYVLPFLCLILFVLYLLKPGMYLNKLLFDPAQLENPYHVVQQMTYGYDNIRILVTLVIPIMIVLSSHNYLMNIKSQSRFLTTPITDGHRILTLWLYAILISFIGMATLYLLDVATVALFRHYFFEETQALNESIGNLYIHYDDHSYFEAIDLSKRILLTSGFLFMLPFYHLMYFLFKKRSILWSSLLYIFLIGITVYAYTNLLPPGVLIPYNLPVKQTIISFTNLSLIALFIITLRFALKEREV